MNSSGFEGLEKIFLVRWLNLIDGVRLTMLSSNSEVFWVDDDLLDKLIMTLQNCSCSDVYFCILIVFYSVLLNIIKLE